MGVSRACLEARAIHRKDTFLYSWFSFSVWSWQTASSKNSPALCLVMERKPKEPLLLAPGPGPVSSFLARSAVGLLWVSQPQSSSGKQHTQLPNTHAMTAAADYHRCPPTTTSTSTATSSTTSSTTTTPPPEAAARFGALSHGTLLLCVGHYDGPSGCIQSIFAIMYGDAKWGKTMSETKAVAILFCRQPQLWVGHCLSSKELLKVLEPAQASTWRFCSSSFYSRGPSFLESQVSVPWTTQGWFLLSSPESCKSFFLSQSRFRTILHRALSPVYWMLLWRMLQSALYQKGLRTCRLNILTVLLEKPRCG